MRALLLAALIVIVCSLGCAVDLSGESTAIPMQTGTACDQIYQATACSSWPGGDRNTAVCYGGPKDGEDPQLVGCSTNLRELYPDMVFSDWIVRCVVFCQ